jgi:hypothetical protein
VLLLPVSKLDVGHFTTCPGYMGIYSIKEVKQLLKLKQIQAGAARTDSL